MLVFRSTPALVAVIFYTYATFAGFAKEIPMWEGVLKSPQQLAADKQLIEAMKKATAGNLDVAAKAAVVRAWQAIGRGDPETAIKRLNQAWLLNPDRGDIYWAYGVATAIRGDSIDAVDRHFRQAERIIGQEARLYADWGRVFEQRGFAEKALPHFKEAIQIDPKNPEPHIGMIRAAMKLGDRETARKHERILLQLKDWHLRLR